MIDGSIKAVGARAAHLINNRKLAAISATSQRHLIVGASVRGRGAYGRTEAVHFRSDAYLFAKGTVHHGGQVAE